MPDVKLIEAFEQIFIYRRYEKDGAARCIVPGALATLYG